MSDYVDYDRFDAMFYVANITMSGPKIVAGPYDNFDEAYERLLKFDDCTGHTLEVVELSVCMPIFYRERELVE